jgi:hypothetical protein
MKSAGRSMPARSIVSSVKAVSCYDDFVNDRNASLLGIRRRERQKGHCESQPKQFE